MNRICICLSFLLISFNAFAQPSKPKLVVGIMIDQMRWDFLYRYNKLYSENGFKRLLNKGYSCENTMIPFVPTYTAVGHASVYTGSIPALTGIVGNNWINKSTGTAVYCTGDSTVTGVGSSSVAGKMSPANMWTTTITDELRLSNNFKSKVIGISLKDRGAILAAGHSGNAAYWYDAGKWISSSYYMNALPGWVNQFNERDLAGAYMSKDWNTLLPLSQYDQSTTDDKPYESRIMGESSVTFPHKLSAIPAALKYEAFRTTPFANSFTLDFAKTAIDKESLGKNSVTDFLAISISSTDYIGHNFGPNSIETEDTYLRLDKDIADFLQYLDLKIGKGQYLVFLTADHGVAHIPGFLAEHKIPAGTFSESTLLSDLNKMAEESFGLKNVVQRVINYQLYLNTALIEKDGKNLGEVKKALIKALKEKPYITNAFSLEELELTTLPEAQRKMISNGYSPQRSGDIQFTSKPAYFDAWQKTGTTHGLWNPYDAHIPLLWYGWNIKPGKTYREIHMTDITPTLAALLQIQEPNGSVGKIITELLK